MDPLSEQEGTTSSGQLVSSPPTLCATSLWNRLRPWASGIQVAQPSPEMVPTLHLPHLEFSSHRFSESQESYWKDREKSRSLT